MPISHEKLISGISATDLTNVAVGRVQLDA